MDPLQIIAEPRRRDILRLIWNAEMSAGDIAKGQDVTFGTVSQHLAVLRDAGYVTVRRQGNHRFYQARPDALGPLRPVLESMWSSTLDVLAQAIEHHDDRR